MIFSWRKHFVLYFLLSAPWSCSSDFNVVLPEICNMSGGLNLTWIRSMVYLGIRDEQSHIALNIVGPEEICDGSKGLLKFISMAYADPNGQMIASLQPHLCPTAATFCHLNQRQFLSWTCSKIPGVNSLKPPHFDVILAIQRMLRYFHWDSVALTKSRFDGSPYCDEVGAYLQNDSRNNENLSVMILGNYEDLDQYEATSVTNNLDGLFLCISYDYGFTHNLSQKTELRAGGFTGQGNANRIPLVLLPEWPLPVELFSPENPMLALVANTHPLTPTTSSFDFQPKIWDSVETDKENIVPNKLLETLLAQMILKSVKISLEFERMEKESTTSSTPKNPHHNMHHQTQHYHNPNSPQQFLFSILQFEKARWHPLINLVHGDKFVTKHPGDRRSTSTEPTPEDDQDFLFTWFKIVLSIFISGALLVVVVATTLHARNRAKRRAFYGTPNCRRLSRRHRHPGPYKIVLTSNDLSFGPTILQDVPKKASRSPFISTISSFQRSSQDKPDLLKGSFGTLRKNSSGTNLKSDAKIVGNIENTARYKGDLVYLKRLAVSSESFEIKIKAMMVLETLHGLRHENLVAMLGCFTDGVPALVWEYCSRGSLHDIIKQCDIKLDWAFKLSLLTDLVRGMRYLHSSMVRVHGFLNSYNCVIDARWVLKITDYGIPAIFHTQGLPIRTRSAKDLLWTSPELLRDENVRRQGTQAADVYSFAIIMQEVLVRGEPYCMLTLTAEEILEKVRRPPPLIRPSVSKGAAPPEAINIMRQCWAELPDMRPDFMVIHDLFKTLNHGRKANIVDTMFQMLEKYSNNLEELIRERTEQLDLEKKKTEQLLNRMLPSTVAEKLKLGLPVDPEEFSEVTIYFSDIVGFTTISAYSTPFEVVDLLNDLYTCFDGTINDYNVYKVETIGDAYMVVGGAPLWSPDHADQIATMALDLLHQSGKFRIRHLPYTPLRLRIGLHTGPCCAGVVGLTMPRYCLFGDTVNTASRMESTGSAWRIHISAETKAKLDEAGSYITEYRGMTDIKGKGTMKTFWLLGKEGFDKILPTPPGLNDSISLDENSISYGRTGKMPVKPSEPVINITQAKDNLIAKGTADVISTSSSSSPHLKPKPCSYGIVPGESLRSLSPAEQVAHQLLNGRPTAKGLRRQLSLDHRTMPLMLQKAKQATFRRAPSLEENTDPTNEIIAPVSLASANSSSAGTSSNSATSTVVAIPTISSSPSQNSTSSTSSTTTTVKSVIVVAPTETNWIPINEQIMSNSNSTNSVSPAEDNPTLSSTVNCDNSSHSNNLTANKLKVSNPRAGKLSKILSVLEESPVLERKFDNATSNHVNN